MNPIVAIIGGFLGAGKTTLILEASGILKERGMRVGVILNDQGDDLVDTYTTQASDLPCDQVTGGCFCCRFPDLVAAIARLATCRPDIIFAEAVGSCTDIVSTTLRPLVRDHGREFRIAPLTVLMHPQRAFDDPDLDFLFRHQLTEADFIFERGDDIAAWLDRLLQEAVPVGAHALDVDYARYAEAEAALAWLNVRVTVDADPPISPAMLVGPLMDRLEAQIRIVHLKLFTQCESGYVKAALTANGQEPQVEGALDASPAARHELLLNVRALTAPEELRAIIEREIAALPGCVAWRHLQCFRPAPPVPHFSGTRT